MERESPADRHQKRETLAGVSSETPLERGSKRTGRFWAFHEWLLLEGCGSIDSRNASEREIESPFPTNGYFFRFRHPEGR